MEGCDPRQRKGKERAMHKGNRYKYSTIMRTVEEEGARNRTGRGM